MDYLLIILCFRRKLKITLSLTLVLYLKNCAIYCLHCSISKLTHHCQNTLLELAKSKINNTRKYLTTNIQNESHGPFFLQVLHIIQKNQVDLKNPNVPTLNIQQA